MADILSFDDKKQDRQGDGWLTGETVCLACGDKGAAVAPCGTGPFLECDKCGCMKKVFTGAFHRNESVEWSCDCGNTLFKINPDGIYCPICGKYQEMDNDNR